MSGLTSETGKKIETPIEAWEICKTNVDKKWTADAMRNMKDMAKDPTGFFRKQAEGSWNRFDAFKKSTGGFDPKLFEGKQNPLDVSGNTPVKDILKRLEACLEVDAKMDGSEAKRGIKGPAATYLRTEVMVDNRPGKDNELYSQIRVDTEKIVNDYKELDKILTLYPDNQGIKKMMYALKVLASVDPADMASTAYAEERSNRPANQAVKYAGKLGATVILTGMVALTGIMALISKKMSIAPFLYGGLLLYIINPDFFNGKDKGALKQASEVAVQPAFFDVMAPRYNMQGPEWEEVFQNVFRMQAKGGGDLKKFDDGNPSMTAKELSESLAPGDRNPAHANVLKLINNKKDFADFREMLAGVKDKKAQDLLAGYVRSGSWQIARKVTPPNGRPKA